MIPTALLYLLATAVLAVAIVLALRSTLAPAKAPRRQSTPGQVNQIPRHQAQTFVPSNWSSDTVIISLSKTVKSASLPTSIEPLISSSKAA